MNELVAKKNPPIKVVMTQTDPTNYQRTHHLVSLPKTPPPTAAKRTPTKKDIEANSPFAITVKKNMTCPITIKVTVYGMTVCIFSIHLLTQKSALLLPFACLPFPPLPQRIQTHTHTHTPNLYLPTYV